MDYQDDKFFDQLVREVREAGKMFGDRTKAGQIKQKGATDFVTQVDFSVQSFLAQRLAQLAPEVQLMGEEKDNSALDFDRPMWILDPVDGTTNLVHGYQHSAVSLALAERGEILIGLIYQPFADELFSARKGRGAFLNGEPIHVSSAPRLADSLVDVGTNPGVREKADRSFSWMRAIYDRCHDVRRMGAASLGLAYVAAGRLEAYVEASLKPWDMAAGLLIVREAGGFVSTPTGAEPSLVKGDDVLATNGHIGPEVLSLLQSL